MHRQKKWTAAAVHLPAECDDFFLHYDKALPLSDASCPTAPSAKLPNAGSIPWLISNCKHGIRIGSHCDPIDRMHATTRKHTRIIYRADDGTAPRPETLRLAHVFDPQCVRQCTRMPIAMAFDKHRTGNASSVNAMSDSRAAADRR
ncbi:MULTISPECIES: hypothetical protein [Burkholderiaceae]|uniref:hypothetical protein n=1 Tax=Burkholderiaceae TaxID=119060 RepID=UPI00141E2A0C|nr:MULTISPECIES: hypothetical protein [Burkholderiaceae]NIF53879.1 hypothetical protein [Burkholderia sp. Ax-1724]NIF77543.1 hypothetical protein [Paraburkholderia sp. Cy-641]